MSVLTPAPRRILLINVTRIGDTLLTTPVIAALAAYWPEAEIDVLAHHERGEVLRHLDGIHHLGSISKRRAAFMGRLGGPRYDLALVYNFDSALVKYALRVSRQVVAFEQADPRLNQKLFRCVRHPGNRNGHLVDANLMLTALLDIPAAGRRLRYAVSASEQAWASQWLAELRQSHPAQPLIGLQIASFPTKAFRDWPVEHFASLCERIRARWPQAHFLLLGGSQEQAQIDALAGLLGPAATVCAGRLSLRESAALMARLDLYIGVDTGPTHLMGAFDRPMVVLYHGYLPSHIARPPDHPCAFIIDHPQAGSCGPDTPMAEISVDTVWAQVQQALEMTP